MTIADEIRDRIANEFKCQPWTISIDAQPGVVTIKLKDFTLKFEHLDWLSELLQTKRIDIGNETKEIGYCDTCRGTEEWLVLTVYGANIQ